MGENEEVELANTRLKKISSRPRRDRHYSSSSKENGRSEHVGRSRKPHAGGSPKMWTLSPSVGVSDMNHDDFVSLESAVDHHMSTQKMHLELIDREQALLSGSRWGELREYERTEYKPICDDRRRHRSRRSKSSASRLQEPESVSPRSHSTSKTDASTKPPRSPT